MAKVKQRIPGLDPIQGLKITITKTSDGLSEYVQILSADQLSVNVVLIAQKITVLDTR